MNLYTHMSRADLFYMAYDILMLANHFLYLRQRRQLLTREIVISVVVDHIVDEPSE